MGRKPNLKKKKVKSPVYVIIGDGKTELIYFEQLKLVESIDSVTLKPDLPEHSGWDWILNKAKSEIEIGVDLVCCIIDMDKVYSDNHLKEYRDLVSSVVREYGFKVRIFEVMPSIENWFLRHYSNSTALLCDNESVDKMLLKHIPDYKKSDRYLREKPIYNHLKPFQNQAFQNARTVNRQKINSDSNCFPICEVGELVMFLLNINSTEIEEVRIYHIPASLVGENEWRFTGFYKGMPLSEDDVAVRTKDFRANVEIEVDLSVPVVSFNVTSADGLKVRKYRVNL